MHSESEKELLWPDHETTETKKPSVGTRWTLYLSIVTNLLLLFAVTHLGVKLHKNGAICERGESLISSPANPYVKYETWQMNNDLGVHNEFMGDPVTHKPTTDQTEAWRKLLSWQDIVVPEQAIKDIGKLNSTSSVLTDGSGHLAVLDVFHQLHCLNYIREYIHKDYYTSPESETMRASHIDHCIDTLRQIAMCHADVTIIPFNWRSDYRYPWPDFSTTRECRNWDSIMEFVQGHQADLVLGSMVHPTLGVVPYKAHGKNRV